MRKLLNLFLALAFGISLSGIYSCSETETIINDIVNNKVTAKDRIDSAFAQAQRKYSGAKLVMIFGKNVLYSGEDAGKTDISLSSGITDPNT